MFIYKTRNNFICIDYLCLLQDDLSKHDKSFENTNFNDFSGIGIHEIFINTMSCHVFTKEQQSTVILTCRNKTNPIIYINDLLLLKQNRVVWIRYQLM